MAMRQGEAGRTLRNKLLAVGGVVALAGVLAFAVAKLAGPMFAPLAPLLALVVMVRILTDRGVSKDLRAWGKGYAGEATVGKLLETLPVGWRVFHDLDLGGENVDHLVVGPAGAFSLEVKNYSGKVVATPKGLYNKGRKQDQIVRQAWRQAHKLRELLGVEVVPMLVFVTDRLEGDHVGKLRVFRPRQAVEHLKGLGRVWDYGEFLGVVKKAEKLVR